MLVYRNVRNAMKNVSFAKSKFPAMFALLFAVALVPTSGGTKSQTKSAATNDAQSQDKMVFVCACLKNKSCSCVTEAKMEGPCACGTEGGPPLKAVPKDSAWAKENRDALAK
jgi:hypothetical protein